MATRLETTILAENEIPAWDALVARAERGTVFHAWRWTRLVAEAFRRTPRVLGVYRNGVLVGGAPLYERRAPGLRIANPPVVAGYAGALVDLPAYERAGRAISEEEQILDALEAGVRREFGYARLVQPPEVVDARPFLWHGWRVTPRYTYRVPLRDPDTMAAAFEHNARKHIRRAEEQGLVVETAGATAEIVRAYADSYARHGERPPAPAPLLAALADSLLGAGLARAFVTRGPSGELHAFKIMVFDDRRAYSWIAGSVHEHLAAGGFSYMTFRSLCDFSRTHRAYDFLGANTPTIARFKRAFGGELVPYWEALHRTPWARSLFALRRVGRR